MTPCAKPGSVPAVPSSPPARGAPHAQLPKTETCRSSRCCHVEAVQGNRPSEARSDASSPSSNSSNSSSSKWQSPTPCALPNGIKRQSPRRPCALPAVILFRDFAVEGMLGEGRFGCVWRCTHRGSGRAYACKQLPKTETSRALARELDCLTRVQGHGNVLRLEGVFESERFVYLLTELCDSGDLFEEISELGGLEEDYTRGLFEQLVLAVHHCHARGVMHRDLKPENVMLTSCKATGGKIVKLADFGLSTRLAPGERTIGWVGSDPYEAPEVLAMKPYDFSADVFSLGVVLFGMLSGTWPSFSTDKEFEAGKDFAWPGWQSVSGAAKSLIRRMLSKDPSKRPTTAEIMDDPWMSLDLESAVSTVEDGEAAAKEGDSGAESSHGQVGTGSGQANTLEDQYVRHSDCGNTTEACQLGSEQHQAVDSTHQHNPLDCAAERGREEESSEGASSDDAPEAQGCMANPPAPGKLSPPQESSRGTGLSALMASLRPLQVGLSSSACEDPGTPGAINSPQGLHQGTPGAVISPHQGLHQRLAEVSLGDAHWLDKADAALVLGHKRRAALASSSIGSSGSGTDISWSGSALSSPSAASECMDSPVELRVARRSSLAMSSH